VTVVPWAPKDGTDKSDSSTIDKNASAKRETRKQLTPRTRRNKMQAVDPYEHRALAAWNKLSMDSSLLRDFVADYEK